MELVTCDNGEVIEVKCTTCSWQYVEMLKYNGRTPLTSILENFIIKNKLVEKWRASQDEKMQKNVRMLKMLKCMKDT